MATVMKEIHPQDAKAWFETGACKYVVQAYKETIPDIEDDILNDSRVRPNAHVVNLDFEDDPVYLMAYSIVEKRILALNVLYVFPIYRKRGLSKWLIARILEQRRNLPVQVTVVHNDKKKAAFLHKFYISQGFQTSGEIMTNKWSETFQDYYWWPRKLTISKRKKDGTVDVMETRYAENPVIKMLLNFSK